MALFELKVSNSVNNETQHVAGLFGMGTGDGFVPQRCLLGTICVQNGLLPLEGYEEFDKHNGNSWYFNAAPTGFVDGFTGDRTGLYVFDDYDVNKLEGEAERLVLDLGQKTLDSRLPKDERGDFCEIIVGEIYGWDTDAFTTAPPKDARSGFAVVENGKLVYSLEAPEGENQVYFEVLGASDVTEGVYARAKQRFMLRALRFAKSGVSPEDFYTALNATLWGTAV